MKATNFFGSAFLVFAIIAFDRLTKLWALRYCQSFVYFNSVIGCQVSFNRGASWGILNDGSTCSFLLVSAVVSAVTFGLIIYTYKRYKAGNFIGGELLVIGGSLSNILDRIFYKGVIDFIELSYKGYYWPSFNVADACIVTGVGMIIALQVYTNDQ